MYAARGAAPGRWSAEQTAAHQEWERRVEMADHEHGAGASAGKAARYDAYAAGREDEEAVRCEDIRIARELYHALESALARPDRAIDILRDALRSMTLRDVMRLRPGTR